MIETYTFSRALHLMRYGGKKMKPINSRYSYKVIDNYLYWYDGQFMGSEDKLRTKHIMGSWIEVKE